VPTSRTAKSETSHRPPACFVTTALIARRPPGPSFAGWRVSARYFSQFVESPQSAMVTVVGSSAGSHPATDGEFFGSPKVINPFWWSVYNPWEIVVNAVPVA